MTKQLFSEEEVGELQSGLSASAKDVRAIEKALLDKLSAPGSQFVIARRNDLVSYAELMREASKAIEDPSNVCVPLMDELDGSGYMIDQTLGAKKLSPRP